MGEFGGMGRIVRLRVGSCGRGGEKGEGRREKGEGRKLNARQLSRIWEPKRQRTISGAALRSTRFSEVEEPIVSTLGRFGRIGL